MKVSVVGCGAVGSFYGAKLCRAGHETHFLLRSDYEEARRHGIRIKSAEGDFSVRPRCARRPEEIGQCDLVLVALKTTANDSFGGLISPLVGQGTAILTLQNGLGNEEQLSRIFPAEQILGGLCFVCLNRIAPATVQHIAHGQVVLGEFRRWPEPRTYDIAAAFRHAGIPCRVSRNLERAHWEKLVWNIPFNGLGVASAAGLACLGGASQLPNVLQPCLSTNQLLSQPDWLRCVRDLMDEVVRTANALGLDVAPALADQMIEKTRSMGAYKASTVLDYERGRTLELEALFLRPLRAAQSAVVGTPRLERLCQVLRRLDHRLRADYCPDGRIDYNL